MSTLKGVPELNKRVRSLRLAFKPIGRRWADATANVMRPAVPSRTGTLRKSFKRRRANQKKATVVGHYTAYFIDAGPRRHVITAHGSKRLGPILTARGGVIYARRVHHRGYAARPFRQRSAEAGLRATPVRDELVRAWNAAA